jgi:hypothetical protein
VGNGSGGGATVEDPARMPLESALGLPLRRASESGGGLECFPFLVADIVGSGGSEGGESQALFLGLGF